MTARRYAEGTTVAVSKTRIELEALLVKHGAAQIMSGHDTVTRTGFVAFTLKERQFRMALLPPPFSRGARNGEQLERERWRQLLLLVKAKLEYVRAGLTDAETEFLAHLVLPNGSTVGTEVRPRLAEAYESGEMPRLLPA